MGSGRGRGKERLFCFIILEIQLKNILKKTAAQIKTLFLKDFCFGHKMFCLGRINFTRIWANQLAISQKQIYKLIAVFRNSIQFSFTTCEPKAIRYNWFIHRDLFSIRHNLQYINNIVINNTPSPILFSSLCFRHVFNT